MHDKKFFYKYATAETVFNILQNRKLKYCSPVLFNDPFDTQTRIHFDFEFPDFVEAFGDEIYKLVHGDEKPTGDISNQLFKDILETWQMAKNSPQKMPKEIFKDRIKSQYEETIKLSENYFEYWNSWWIKFVTASRIFCVTEEPDNLLMLAHYAKDHTGVVIEFECLPELDTLLCGARKVDYVKTPPVIAKLEEYLKYITGQEANLINHDLLMYTLFLSKSEHWEYEKEWRVFIPPHDLEDPNIPIDADGNEILFDFLSYHPKEIHALYFGCKIKDGDKERISECLSGDFAHVKKYESRRMEKEYKIIFEMVE